MMGAFSPNRAFNLSQNLFRFRTQSITLRDEVDDEIFEHAWQLVVRHQPDANFWFVELLDDRAFTVWDVMLPSSQISSLACSFIAACSLTVKPPGF